MVVLGSPKFMIPGQAPINNCRRAICRVPGSAKPNIYFPILQNDQLLGGGASAGFRDAKAVRVMGHCRVWGKFLDRSH